MQKWKKWKLIVEQRKRRKCMSSVLSDICFQTDIMPHGLFNRRWGIERSVASVCCLFVCLFVCLSVRCTLKWKLLELLSLEWNSDGVMDDDSGELLTPTQSTYRPWQDLGVHWPWDHRFRSTSNFSSPFALAVWKMLTRCWRGSHTSIAVGYTLWTEKKRGSTEYICGHNSGKTHSIFIIFALL